MGISRVPAGSEHYGILGVDPSAGAEEIRGAYLSLARKLHPDLSGDPETVAAMSRANAAYEALLAERSARSRQRLPGGLVPTPRLSMDEAIAPYRSVMGLEGPRSGRLLDVKA